MQEGVIIPFTKFKRMAGSMTLPSFFVVRCRCGPVDMPVFPETAMTSPALTYCESRTRMEDR